MSESSRPVNYQGYPILNVRIISVHPGRLVVSLPDRRRGYINKRNWTWDRSIRADEREFVKDVKIDAVLLPEATERGRPLLSLAHLRNPWAECPRYAKGEYTLGEIVNLRGNTIYVQLHPGVTAAVHSDRLPLLPDQLPEDELSVGDRVWAAVTAFDPGKEHVAIDLLHPLVQAERDWELDLKAAFQEELISLIEGADLNAREIKPRSRFHFTTPLDGLHRILLVEDNPVDRRNVTDLLETELYAQVTTVDSAPVALHTLAETGPYDLVLTDLNLEKDDNGLQLIDRVWQDHPEQAVALMSNNALMDIKLREFEQKIGRRLLFLEKPATKELAERFIQGLRHRREGKIRINTEPADQHDDRMLTSLRQALQRGGSRRERIKNQLKDLCLVLNASWSILVMVDERQKKAEVVEWHSLFNEEFPAEQADNLYYSQVRNVAVENDILYRNQESNSREPIRLHNFFPGINFYACYGVPVEVPLTDARYALIVLDRADDISGMATTRILAAAAGLGSLLEHEAMLKIVRKQQDLALQGTLMGTLLHELNNKLAPLFSFLEEGPELQAEGRKREFWNYVSEVGPDLLGIQELIQAYTRLAKADLRDIAVNEILEKVERQLTPQAQESGIRITLQSDPRQPRIKGFPIHLEQALTNVLLNAIQWVDEQNYRRRNINRGSGRQVADELQARYDVRIGVCEYPNENVCCILIADEGPGVPYHLREVIFDPYVSQRTGGQGLGLHLSRDLVETMGGRLVYVDSVRFVGSLFALLFPIASPQSVSHE